MAESVEGLIARIKGANELYEILGVEKGADDSSLTKAYRKLAMKLHPDKCQVPGGDDAFKKVSNAFGVLKDVDQRAHYDRYGSSGEVGHSGGGGGGHPFGGAGGMPFDAEDLFAEMFRDHPAFRDMGSGNRRQRRGGAGGGGGFQGFPGGVQFSFNGMPMGGATRGGGGGPVPLTLPEPFATVLGFLGRHVPTQFLVLGAFFFFLYFATVVIGFIMRNLVYVFALSYAPLPGSIKAYLWCGFILAGVLGYV